ncbi:MAG: TlpA family protein disulfide reductase [Clostridia bacterium]|nr:TlpA family protein disulfide reductase [Clostridia bacterium]
MNNEEKKPQEGGEVVENKAPATSSAPKTGGWWQKLSTGAKAGIIAGISCLAIAIVVLVIVLAGCNGNGDNGGQGNNGGNDLDILFGKTEDYSITVVTKGGMAFNQLPVYIYEYEDGALGDMVDDGGYGATNESGKVTFKLPVGKEYAAVVNLSLPQGYDAQPFYPLVSDDLTITVSSEVISDTSLVGVTYNLGSVMHDFTVNSTILVKNENGELEFKDEVFTLSEALKEKDAVLINFWYTTCSWCITEFPYMQKAYENWSDDIAIIALDPYADDTISMIESFQGEYGLTFNVAQENYGIASAFNVTGYPTSVMVDRYGVVTMIEAGAIPSERAFNLLFEYYTADNYVQKLIATVNELVPKEKPDVEMPSSEELSQIFDKGTIDGVTYLPYRDSASDEEKEYSWPFVIDQLEFEGELYDVIKSSNAFKEGSFAQLLFDVHLDAGEVLAFDYFASTELGADILYVVVNDKDIYSISGQGTGWETCYAFVAEESATYEVGLVYAKDSSDDVGNDTVYLKDLRIVTEADIDSPTYIYRFAATNPDKYNNYQNFINPILGSDGYYHVNSADGPILLADLMSYTRFAEDNTVYYMATELLNNGQITAAEYDKIVNYCNYASNSAIYGVCSVTPELKDLLNIIVEYFGNPDEENDWQRICCYYDAYGTDGKQLQDPIKGLALFSAFDVVESEKGSTDFPNSFTYDRVIMPRGLLGKFTPEVSGTYLITSNTYDAATDTHAECNAWIFTADGFGERNAWLSYDNVARHNIYDNNNCYMIAYLEAGKDYYIDIAYYDVYGEGTIKYRVERLGDEGYYRFSLASPGFFTALESVTGELTETIAGGIDVVLGDDGIWREKRNDGRVGSILYADFTMTTPIFTVNTLGGMIDRGAFNFTRDEDGESSNLGGDCTEQARKIYESRIQVGYNEQLGEYIEEGDERIGCVIVTEEVAELLQKLMDKYTFKGVENSWTKLCYYHQYFCAETPN